MTVRASACAGARADFGIPAEIHYASDRDIQTQRLSLLALPLKQHASSNRYALPVIWESVLRESGWVTAEGWTSHGQLQTHARRANDTIITQSGPAAAALRSLLVDLFFTFVKQRCLF